MVLTYLCVESRTLPYRTPLRSPSTREADGRRSGSTALTTAIGGKPNRLRSTSNSDLCDRCLQEGYTSEDAPTSHSKPVPNEQAEDKLLGCAPSEGLTSRLEVTGA